MKSHSFKLDLCLDLILTVFKVSGYEKWCIYGNIFFLNVFSACQWALG